MSKSYLSSNTGICILMLPHLLPYASLSTSQHFSLHTYCFHGLPSSSLVWMSNDSPVTPCHKTINHPNTLMTLINNGRAGKAGELISQLPGVVGNILKIQVTLIIWPVPNTAVNYLRHHNLHEEGTKKPRIDL